MQSIPAYLLLPPPFAGVAPLSVQAVITTPTSPHPLQIANQKLSPASPFAHAGVAPLSVQASGPNTLSGAQPSATRWLVTFPFWASGNVPLLSATANADLAPANSLVSAGVVTDASANITGQLAIR